MLSQTLQIFTLLTVSIIATDVPSSQALSGFPNIPGLPDLTGLDKCAVTCTMSAYTSALQACPVMTDFACFCKNQDFVANSKACIVSSCPLDFIPKAAVFATKMCASVGVTLPDSVTAKPASNVSAPSAPTATTAHAVPTASATNGTATQAALNSTIYDAPTTNSAANVVPVTSTPVASIPAPTNAVNTPATAIQVNSSTVVKPATAKPSTSISSAPQTSSSDSNGTQEFKDDESSASSSASSSIQATGTFMILTTLAVSFLL